MSVQGVSGAPSYFPEINLDFLGDAVNYVHDNRRIIAFVAHQSLNFLSSLFFIVTGIKEILLDSHPNWIKITPNKDAPESVQKIQRAAAWFIRTIRNPAYTLADRIRFTVHGALVLSSGVIGSFAALHHLGAICLQGTIRFFQFASSQLCIFANFIYIDYNLEKFIEAGQIARTAKGDDLIRARGMQVAAFLGMFSNLSYIAGAIAALCAAPHAALICAVIGVIATTLRVILEFYLSVFYPHHKHGLQVQ